MKYTVCCQLNCAAFVSPEFKVFVLRHAAER